ncbi:lysozyme inhibitor LprI family protein [Sphingomonas sanguinis]|uniref:lysozyme inhibitor LprI family protein n=1 Tax=Sphingomonas sanguinis TaxID=33051 RepID=UPI000A991F4B|nr:hypothetical protein [Sphingomonas sanguinis]
MRERARILVVLVVALWGLALTPARLGAAGPAEGPSFSCAKAGNAVERAICGSVDLSAADRTMASLYSLAKVSAFGQGPSNQFATQRETVKNLAACETSNGRAAMASCIARVYARRNNDLAIALALSAPDRALPIIRRNDPVFAPVIEAIALWASEPRDADWSKPERAEKRSQILTLMAPSAAIMFTDKDPPWGRDLLRDGSQGVSVATVGDILTSDRHFAFFLNALGPYLPEGMGDRAGSFDRAIPCAAIIRHPALLQATESLFGSTLDNFVFANDCGTTTPPLPRLAALSAQLNQSWPPCEGTIRFAAYRVAMTAYDEARLGRAPHNSDAWPRERYGVSAAALQAVRAELADYYVTYLGKTPEVGRVMAHDSLKGIFATTHQCE